MGDYTNPLDDSDEDYSDDSCEDGDNPLLAALGSSDSDSDSDSESDKEEERDENAPKGTAVDLLASLMVGVNFVAPEPEPEPEKVVIVKKPKKAVDQKKRQMAIDRMKQLKNKDNANKADAAAEVKAAAVVEVDESLAGPFGRTKSLKHTAVASFLRKKNSEKDSTPDSDSSPAPNGDAAATPDALPSVDYVSPEDIGKTFTCQELSGARAQLPKGVDPRRRECYMADDEFVRTFQTQRAQFNKLPKWRRDKLKKDLGLF